jgi:hypothetical protein
MSDSSEDAIYPFFGDRFSTLFEGEKVRLSRGQMLPALGQIVYG